MCVCRMSYPRSQSLCTLRLTIRSLPAPDRGSQLPESAYQLQLLGLNLLALLAQNRVGEFHTELELLPPDAIHNNVYIKYPVALEQYLMEGSYNKVRRRGTRTGTLCTRCSGQAVYCSLSTFPSKQRIRFLIA